MDEILLIDDDVELCSMLTEYLGKNGFVVRTAHRGDTGLKAAQQKPWSLILLDAMLPGMDGFEVLRRIRAESSVNVMLLTARGEDVDRIVGLEIGADDYVPKPFNPRELLARMRAVLRRTASPSPVPSEALRVDNLQLDFAGRKALKAGNDLNLTDVEFALLEMLMRSAGTVVNREDLSQSVLGRPFDPFDRSLDMHVSRLRKKLGEAGKPDDQVKSIRGVGYQLTVQMDLTAKD